MFQVPDPSQAVPEKIFKTAGAAGIEEWQGFFAVPGINIHFKTSGFAVQMTVSQPFQF